MNHPKEDEQRGDSPHSNQQPNSPIPSQRRTILLPTPSVSSPRSPVLSQRYPSKSEINTPNRPTNFSNSQSAVKRSPNIWNGATNASQNLASRMESSSVNAKTNNSNQSTSRTKSTTTTPSNSRTKSTDKAKASINIKIPTSQSTARRSTTGTPITTTPTTTTTTATTPTPTTTTHHVPVAGSALRKSGAPKSKISNTKAPLKITREEIKEHFDVIEIDRKDRKRAKYGCITYFKEYLSFENVGLILFRSKDKPREPYRRMVFFEIDKKSHSSEMEIYIPFHESGCYVALQQCKPGAKKFIEYLGDDDQSIVRFSPSTLAEDQFVIEHGYILNRLKPILKSTASPYTSPHKEVNQDVKVFVPVNPSPKHSSSSEPVSVSSHAPVSVPSPVHATTSSLSSSSSAQLSPSSLLSHPPSVYPTFHSHSSPSSSSSSHQISSINSNLSEKRKEKQRKNEPKKSKGKKKRRINYENDRRGEEDDDDEEEDDDDMEDDEEEEDDSENDSDSYDSDSIQYKSRKKLASKRSKSKRSKSKRVKEEQKMYSAEDVRRILRNFSEAFTSCAFSLLETQGKKRKKK